MSPALEGALARRVLLAALLVLPVGAQTADRHSCAITNPPSTGFVPPASFPTLDANRFYFGTGKLWTALFKDWAVVGVKTEQGYRVKFPWFADDIGAGDEKAGLLVEGRRIDDHGPPLLIEGPNIGITPDHQFFASALIFPASGCWEISAKRKHTVLKFTVWIDGSAMQR